MSDAILQPAESAVSAENRDETLSFDAFVATLPRQRPRAADTRRENAANAARRRALKRKAIAGTEYLAADPCAYCNAPAPTTLDHVEPVSRGGAHALNNVVRACWDCNKEKGTKSLLVFLAGRRRP